MATRSSSYDISTKTYTLINGNERIAITEGQIIGGFTGNGYISIDGGNYNNYISTPSPASSHALLATLAIVFNFNEEQRKAFWAEGMAVVTSSSSPAYIYDLLIKLAYKIKEDYPDAEDSER